MTPEAAQESVLKTGRRIVLQMTRNVMSHVATGQGLEFRNPFTEQISRAGVSPEVRAFAGHIRAAKLHENEAFMAALRAFTEEMSSASLFKFFTALDGEGAFEDDVRVELRLVGGESLPGGLHDCFYPIERETEDFEARHR